MSFWFIYLLLTASALKLIKLSTTNKIILKVLQIHIENFDTVGDYLRALRKNEGLSQVQLAEKIGTIDTHISKWETNRNDIGRPYALKLSAIFDVPVVNFENFNNQKKERSSVNEENRLTPESAAREARRRIGAGEFSGRAEDRLLQAVLETLQDIQITLGRLIETRKDK